LGGAVLLHFFGDERAHRMADVAAHRHDIPFDRLHGSGHAVAVLFCAEEISKRAGAFRLLIDHDCVKPGGIERLNEFLKLEPAVENSMVQHDGALAFRLRRWVDRVLDAEPRIGGDAYRSVHGTCRQCGGG
jgi:hypothetical protein